MTLQWIHYGFFPRIDFKWDSSITYVAENITSAVSKYPSASTFRVSEFMIAAIVAFSIPLITLGAIVTRKYLKWRWHLPIVRHLLELNAGVLFIPTVSALGKMLFGCFAYQPKSNMANPYFETVTCWSSIHILYAFICVILLALQLWISILANFIFVDYRITTNLNHVHKLSASTGRFIAFDNICQFVLLALFTGIHNTTGHYPLSVILAASGALNAYFNLTYLPFYEESTQALVLYRNLMQCMMGLVALLVTAVDSYEQGPALVFYTLTPLLLVFSVLAIRTRFAYVDTLTLRELTKGYLFELKARCILRQWAFREVDATPNFFLDDNEERQQRFQTMQEAMARILQLGIARFMNDPYLHLYVAIFYTNVMDNRVLAYTELQAALNRATTFDLFFAIHSLREKLDQDTATNQSLEVRSYLEFKQRKLDVDRTVLETTRALLEFWSQLLRPTPDAEVLAQQGHLARISMQTAVAHYEKLLSINPNSIPVLEAYGAFAGDILGDLGKAIQLYERAKEVELSRSTALQSASLQSDFLQTLETNLDIFDDRNGVFQITLDRAHLGEIESTNLSARKSFGYSSASEVLGKNINIITPSPFAEEHDTYLTNFLKRKSGRIINTTRVVFALHKQGYILPGYLYVRWADAANAKIIGVWQEKAQQEDQTVLTMMVDAETNAVTYCTQNAYGILGLSRKQLQHREIKLAQIIPMLGDSDIDRAERAFELMKSRVGLDADVCRITDNALLRAQIYGLEVPVGASKLLFIRVAFHRRSESTRRGRKHADANGHPVAATQLDGGFLHDYSSIQEDETEYDEDEDEDEDYEEYTADEEDDNEEDADLGDEFEFGAQQRRPSTYNPVTATAGLQGQRNFMSRTPGLLQSRLGRSNPRLNTLSPSLGPSSTSPVMTSLSPQVKSVHILARDSTGLEPNSPLILGQSVVSLTNGQSMLDLHAQSATSQQEDSHHDSDPETSHPNRIQLPPPQIQRRSRTSTGPGSVSRLKGLPSEHFAASSQRASTIKTPQSSATTETKSTRRKRRPRRLRDDSSMQKLKANEGVTLAQQLKSFDALSSGDTASTSATSLSTQTHRKLSRAISNVNRYTSKRLEGMSKLLLGIIVLFFAAGLAFHLVGDRYLGFMETHVDYSSTAAAREFYFSEVASTVRLMNTLNSETSHLLTSVTSPSSSLEDVATPLISRAQSLQSVLPVISPVRATDATHLSQEQKIIYTKPVLDYYYSVKDAVEIEKVGLKQGATLLLAALGQLTESASTALLSSADFAIDTYRPLLPRTPVLAGSDWRARSAIYAATRNGLITLPMAAAQDAELSISVASTSTRDLIIILSVITGVVVTAVVLVLIFAIYPIILRVEESKSQVLAMFLDIPRHMRRNIRRRVYRVFVKARQSAEGSNEENGADDAGDEGSGTEDLTRPGKQDFNDDHARFIKLAQQLVNQTVSEKDGNGAKQKTGQRAETNISSLMQQPIDLEEQAAHARTIVQQLNLQSPRTDGEVEMVPLKNEGESSSTPHPKHYVGGDQLAASGNTDPLDAITTGSTSTNNEALALGAAMAKRALRIFSFKYLLFAAVAAAYFTSLIVVTSVILTETQDLMKSAIYAYRRAAAYSRAYTAAREYAFFHSTDTDAAEPNTGVRAIGDLYDYGTEQLALAERLHHAVIFGDAGLGVKAAVSTHNSKIYYGTACELQADAIGNSLSVYQQLPATYSVNCDNFSSGLLTHGLHGALILFQDYAAFLFDPQRFGIFGRLIRNPTTAPSVSNPHSNDPVSVAEAASRFQVVHQLYNDFLVYALEYSAAWYVHDAKTKMFDFNATRIGLTVAYCISIAFVYLFIFHPMTRALNTSARNTRAMMFVLPPDVAKSVPSVQKFIAENHFKRD